MKLCQACSGKGCEFCDFEGMVEATPSKDKIIHKRKYSHQEYEAKKSKAIKFDKKNASKE